MVTQEWNFKVLLIGPSAAGKTSLLRRFLNRKFDSDYNVTIGLDYHTQQLQLPSQQHHLRLQLWDTAGQERFRAVSSQYYRGAACVIIVYDAHDHASFDQVPSWYDEVMQRTGASTTPPPVVVLVANKCDLEPEVSSEQGRSMATHIHAQLYFQTSAKDATRQHEIDDLFRTVAQMLCDQHIADATCTQLSPHETRGMMDQSVQVDLPTMPTKCFGCWRG